MLYLITDTHFGHRNIIKYCNRPENFEDLIFDNLYKIITNNDILLHLGDVAYGPEKLWIKMYMHIPGEKWLVKGNHDRKKTEWYEALGFTKVYDEWFRYVDNDYGTIVFSHKPRDLEQFTSYNIHGHCHNSEIKSFSEDSPFRYHAEYNKRLSIELENYKPVSLNNFLNR